MNLLRRLCISLFCLPLLAHAAELTIDQGHGAITYRTDALLRRDDVRTISVPADVAFHRAMHYRAIPLAALLRETAPTDHLQFVGNDGFSAEIPAAVILNGRGSEAWLAIEDPARPWPALPGNHGSAGPFYVVWTLPQAARVNPDSGRINWQPSANSATWPTAFRSSGPIHRCRRTVRHERVSRCSSALAWPAIRSTAKATRKSVRT